MNENYFAIQNFLQLTDELRSAIKQSDPQVKGSLTTAGEMFEDWLLCMPKEVKVYLKKRYQIDLNGR